MPVFNASTILSLFFFFFFFYTPWHSESSLTRDLTQAPCSERAVSGVLTTGLPGKCIDDYSFVVYSLKPGSVKPLALFFFLKMTLAIWGSFVVSHKFQDYLFFG